MKDTKKVTKVIYARESSASFWRQRSVFRMIDLADGVHHTLLHSSRVNLCDAFLRHFGVRSIVSIRLAERKRVAHVRMSSTTRWRCVSPRTYVPGGYDLVYRDAVYLTFRAMRFATITRAMLRQIGIKMSRESPRQAGECSSTWGLPPRIISGIQGTMTLRLPDRVLTSTARPIFGSSMRFLISLGRFQHRVVRQGLMFSCENQYAVEWCNKSCTRQLLVGNRES